MSEGGPNSEVVAEGLATISRSARQQGKIIDDLLNTELNGIRVLAIDDDEDSRDLLSHFLKKSGAQVLIADSAVDGIHHAAGFNPGLVICDLSMPEEDGYSFIRKLRQS
ncbi:MAG: response regulator [Cryobacterium sp.]|nr:response regulator [Oligoflexia bacterium]